MTEPLVPASLSDPGLSAFWEHVRLRVERHGWTGTGRVRVPDLSSTARLALGALLNRPVSATIDLAALEHGLRRLGVGDGLADALARLGHPVSTEPERRRAERRRGQAARAAARQEAATWAEPWSGPWIDEVIRAGVFRGLDPDAAVALVASVRTVLDRLDGVGPGERLARVDLAADLFGSSHALDTGTRMETATTRALAWRQDSAEPRALWENAGAHLDLTSGPALTWRLPVTSGLAPVVQAATALGVPLHLTQFMLKQHPVAIADRAVVLVVENPRIVEAAAQTNLGTAVVATNGNPSRAVQMLLDQLLASGAALRYHGDFDVAGLTLCARMAHLGLVPWRMDSTSYLDAIASARADNVDLPRDDRPAPPTPWDPHLQSAFNEGRLIVHEERLLPALLV